MPVFFRTFVLCYIFMLSSGNIFLDDETNGYEGIVIGVADDGSYDETNATQLIDNIKALFDRASSRLYSITHNQLYFKNITILLPNSWSKFSNIDIDHLSTNELLNHAAIRVHNVNPEQGYEPYTLQRRDCSEPGDFIHLTPGFLHSITNISTAKRHFGDPVKKFVGEWIKFRFGVFDEDNLDLFYYDPEQQKFTASYCANEVPNGTLTNPETKTLCDVNDMGMPLEYCRFELDLHDNDNLISSLLFTTSLDSVTELCNETTHNIYSPTLHNRRCKGKSVWEIMKQHPDFNNITNMYVASTLPTYTIVASHEFPTLILALDSAMNKNESIVHSVIASVSTYFLFVIPENITVKIVTVGDYNETQCYSTTISSFNDRLDLITVVQALLNYPVNVSQNSSNDVCDPKQDMMEPWDTGTVVYLTASKQWKGNWSRLNGARFMPIFLNVTTNKSFQDLAHDTDGISYAFFGDEWQLEEDLNSALFDVSRYWDGDLIIQVATSLMSNKDLPVNYLVESDIVDHVNIIVSTPKDTVSGSQLLLISPNKIFDANDIVNYTVQEKTFFTFNSEGKKAGMWSLRTTYPLSSKVKLVVKVVAVMPQMTPAAVPSVQIYNREIWPVNGVIPVPILTMTLKKGAGFTTPASATATLYSPFNEHGSNTTISVSLRDDGAGPDVIQNDGVYSATLYHIASNGIYKIVTTVYGGSGVECSSGTYLNYECFQRVPCPLYFEVNGYTQGIDILPGNITDLFGKVKLDKFGNTLVSLFWTAPGDISSDGIIQGYDLQIFPSYENAFKFVRGTAVTNHMIVSGSLEPYPAGGNQSVTVKFTTEVFGYLKTGYISIRASDDHGRHGYGSNIVTIPLTTDDDQSTTLSPDVTTGNITDDVVPTSTVHPKDHAYDGVIASACLLLIAIVSAVGVYAYQKIISRKSKKRRRKHSKQPCVNIIGYPSTATLV